MTARVLLFATAALLSPLPPPSGTTIGVLAKVVIGHPMTVSFPVVREGTPHDERLLFEAESSLGVLKIHEDGSVESTMPMSVSADQFYAALALAGKTLPYEGPHICYIPKFTPAEELDL